MHFDVRRLACLALVGVCFACATSAASAATPPPPRFDQEVAAALNQAPAPPAADALKELKIVLVANRKDHGPEEHDYPLWMERWRVLLAGKQADGEQANLFGPANEAVPAKGAAKVQVETAKDWPTAEQFAQADLVVAFMGTGAIWNEAKLADLKAFLARGGGFVALHSATIAEKPYAQPLAEMIGLAWESGYTLFRHGPANVEIVAPDHPICKGLPAKIRFIDETYWPLVGDAKGIELLATADEQAKDGSGLQPQPMFWTKTVGKGRVYSCILGHYTWTFDDPYFRILILRGMAWAAGESPYRFDPLVLVGARTSDKPPADTSLSADALPVAPDAADPNLLLWLDSSDGGTITRDAAGRVSAWANKAANVGGALASAAEQQPLFVEKAIGGRPAVRFDGENDVLRHLSFNQEAPAWTAVVVVTPRSNKGTHRGILAANQPGKEDFQTGFNIDLGAGVSTDFGVLNLEGAKGGLATNLRTDSAPFGQGQLLILSTGVEASRLWVNGVEEGSRDAKDVVTSMGELRLGSRYFWNGERGYFDGDVSEVLLYKSELDDAARASLYAHLLQKYSPDIRPPSSYTLDDAWQYLPRYDWGMARRPLDAIDETLRGDDAQARQQLEPHLIAVLENASATPAAKSYACQRLGIVATAASIPALAALLPDRQLSHMASIVLERIPDNAADEALRTALDKVDGQLRLGLVSALGNRRSQAAVPALARLLAADDAAVSETAAKALGKIGSLDAARVLLSGFGHSVKVKASPATLAASSLMCAEQLGAAGKEIEAQAIYQQLREPDAPATVRRAATRGAILTGGARALPLLVESLKSAEPDDEVMALLLARDLPGTEVTAALAAQLNELSPDKAVRLLTALADRGDAAAKAAVLAAATGNQPAVRLAALRALGLLGDASDVPVLLAALASSEKDIIAAAEASLFALRGQQVDAALVAAVERGDAPTRARVITLIGRRGYAPAIARLIALARSSEPAVQSAAFKALGASAAVADAPALVNLLIEARDPAQISGAEAAINDVYARSGAGDDAAAPLVAMLPQAQPAAKAALMGVLSRLAGPQSLAAVKDALDDRNAEVQLAAVRVLADWPTPAPAADLLTIAKAPGDETRQVLALRGYLRMAGNESLPPAERLAMCREGLKLARGDEERRLTLGVLAGVPSAEALALALPLVENEAVREEAAAAVVAIGERIVADNRAAVAAAAQKVAASGASEDIRGKAAELLKRAK